MITRTIHSSVAMAIQHDLQQTQEHLHSTLLGKEEQLKEVVKTGRTHLMDAMPVTMGQELQGWASQIAGNHHRLAQALAQLMHIPQGGTAVGTGINAQDRKSGV